MDCCLLALPLVEEAALEGDAGKPMLVAVVADLVGNIVLELKETTDAWLLVYELDG